MGMKPLNRDGNSITYANPTDPNFQVRIKTSSAKKVLKGNPVDNYITDIIATDDHAVELPTSAGKVEDALSVRIRTSGTVYGHERILKILQSLATNYQAWYEEGVFVGFEPATLPQYPAA